MISLLVKLPPWKRRRREAWVGPAPEGAASRGDRPVGHGHDDHPQAGLGKQLLELVLAVEQDGLQGQLDAVVAQFGQGR